MSVRRLRIISIALGILLIPAFSYAKEKQRFESKEFGVSIVLPPQWQQIEPSTFMKSRITRLIQVKAPESFSSMTLTVQTLDAKFDFEKYKRTRTKRFLEIGLKDLKTGDIVLGGIPAVWEENEVTVDKEPFTLLSYYLVHNNNLYTLNCRGESKTFQQFKKKYFAPAAASLAFK